MKNYAWVLALAYGMAVVVQKPALALVLGLMVGVFSKQRIQGAGQVSKTLLQFSVVFLGFGLSIADVLQVGGQSFGITAVSITATLALGLLLNRVFGCARNTAWLISSGTAICGGSAIAAVAPALGAQAAETAVAMAVVFLLNALALIVFPYLGEVMGMAASDFGVWAALAIHDTSSVVGAASAFDPQSLGIATTVKLSRALWILPLALMLSRIYHRQGAARFPWFLPGFLGASALVWLFPQASPAWEMMEAVGRLSLVATLFLIGTTLTRESLRQLGGRSLGLAASLWVVVSGLSAWFIQQGWIHLG